MTVSTTLGSVYYTAQTRKLDEEHASLFRFTNITLLKADDVYEKRLYFRKTRKQNKRALNRPGEVSSGTNCGKQGSHTDNFLPTTSSNINMSRG
ncbi:hypothetical protein AKJ16_DCAP02401 [Drosera capensis]